MLNLHPQAAGLLEILGAAPEHRFHVDEIAARLWAGEPPASFIECIRCAARELRPVAETGWRVVMRRRFVWIEDARNSGDAAGLRRCVEAVRSGAARREMMAGRGR